MTRRKPKGEPYPPLRGDFPTAVGKPSEAETGPKASPSQWGGGLRSGSVGRFRSDLPEGDDGRTIVSMNVEGMPWYAPEAPGASRAPGMGEDGPEPPRVQLTREESRVFVWGALKAALLVTGVMCLGIVLFVLFCQFVWFK